MALPRYTFAFIRATRDLPDRVRERFAEFVEHMDGSAFTDEQKLLALRHTWVISKKPAGVHQSPEGK